MTVLAGLCGFLMSAILVGWAGTEIGSAVRLWTWKRALRRAFAKRDNG